MQIRAMLCRMDLWLTLFIGMVLLLVSKGPEWGVWWIDVLERLDSFRTWRRLCVGPADRALGVCRAVGIRG